MEGNMLLKKTLYDLLLMCVKILKRFKADTLREMEDYFNESDQSE